VLVRFGGILFLVALAIWLYCLLDAITADRELVRGLPKGVWIAIVLLTFEVGAIAWWIWGRPKSTAARRPRLGSSGRTAWPARPDGPRQPPTGTGMFGRSGQAGRPAPDDDPEFLAGLDRQAAADHEKLLDSWEEDLRRREERLRRDGPQDDPEDPPPATT
jgi:hypothetical protein